MMIAVLSPWMVHDAPPSDAIPTPAPHVRGACQSGASCQLHFARERRTGWQDAQAGAVLAWSAPHGVMGVRCGPPLLLPRTPTATSMHWVVVTLPTSGVPIGHNDASAIAAPPPLALAGNAVMGTNGATS